MPDLLAGLKRMEIMEKALELADSLSIRITQLQGYDVFDEDSTKETKARNPSDWSNG